MVGLVIVGTIGLDDIKTPFGTVRNVLGGAATYAAFAASFFAQPGVVSVVGSDFPKEHLQLLINRNICLKGLKTNGKTFRWSGLYEFDMNEAKTLKTELNCVLNFNPELPEDYKNAEYVFLANIDPELQLKALEQIKNPKLVALDTMNYWISNKKEKLLEAIGKVNLLIINDAEARQLFETPNLVKVAKKALALGLKAIIIKKGEHGALLFTKSTHFNAPGYPLEDLKDPTGAGDSFAGALMGYIASTDDISDDSLRRAVIYGSIIASFSVEGFSLERLKKLTKEDIDNRLLEFRTIREF